MKKQYRLLLILIILSVLFMLFKNRTAQSAEDSGLSCACTQEEIENVIEDNKEFLDNAIADEILVNLVIAKLPQDKEE